jgi:hypothetical protein
VDNETLMRRLDSNASTGADLSPGDPVCAAAAERIRELEAKLTAASGCGHSTCTIAEPHGHEPHKPGDVALSAPVPLKYFDLNLEPIGHCDRCGRKVWKRETIGAVDEMKQPGGSICGGRFVADGEAAK